MSKTLLTTGLMLAFIMAPQALEAAGKCDLVPWMIKSPGIRARQTQPLILEIYNAGDAPSGAYTVGFKLDGELIGETHFDEGVPLWGDCDVMVEGSVTLEYGRTYQVEAYVNTDEPDGNPSNNTITSTFTMPDAPAPNYPYYWDDATCLQDFTYDSEGWSFAWGFDYNTNAFYISERASNWFGSLTTTKPITFAEGDVVTCSFDYGTSGGAVKLVLAENSQYYSEPFAEQLLPESPVDFSHATISFVAPGPMTVDLYPELQADFYTYGAFFIRNICFAPAAPDMATDAILSPQFQAVACSTDPIDVVVRYTNNGAFDIEAPIFSYSYEGQTVDETYGGTFAAGSSIDYHFHTPIMAVTVTDEAELSAWCTSANDSDASNNRINTSFSIYEPVSFPYTTDFQDDPTIDLWSTLDSDGNGWTWDFTQAGYYGGPVLICDYGKFDDYLIMPAVQMPAGRSRFTFGYWNMFSAARMRVLMGRTPSISAMTDVICDYNLVNGIEGYALLDIEEPGLYYLRSKESVRPTSCSSPMSASTVVTVLLSTALRTKHRMATASRHHLSLSRLSTMVLILRTIYVSSTRQTA